MIVHTTDKKRIPFQIDEEDYEAVSWYPWKIGSAGYPMTRIGKAGWVNGKRTEGTLKYITVQRFLLGKPPPGLVRDHINRDRLDNRRSNLRVTTQTVNARNRGIGRDNKSGFMGVFFRKKQKKWEVSIRVGGNKQQYIGWYSTFEDAVAARKRAEAELW